MFFDEVIDRIAWTVESVSCWPCFVADHLEERSINDGRGVHRTATEVRHLAWCFMDGPAARADGFDHEQFRIMFTAASGVQPIGIVTVDGLSPTQHALPQGRQPVVSLESYAH